MNNFKTIALAVFVAISTLTTAQNKKIDAAKSKIEWLGKKMTGQHNGTINFKGGTLIFKGKKVTGGSFVVDMNSLNTTDLEGDSRNNLNGHLKADDFFGTEKYPTSKLVFKKVTDKGNGVFAVTADLTIKETTAPVNFEVDRTKYGIKYGSGSFFADLGNKAINDDFDLTVTMHF